jgi:hypothetical protein
MDTSDMAVEVLSTVERATTSRVLTVVISLVDCAMASGAVSLVMEAREEEYLYLSVVSNRFSHASKSHTIGIRNSKGPGTGRGFSSVTPSLNGEEIGSALCGVVYEVVDLELTGDPV